MYSLLLGYCLIVVFLSVFVLVLWGFAYSKYQNVKYVELTDWPSITIIIPTYNEANIILQTLQSLMSQIATYSGTVEVLVIDDGSTDNTVSIIKVSFPEIAVVHDGKNKGKAQRVLQGAKLATGDIVMLLDADITLRENALKVLVSALMKNPQASTVQPAIHQVAANVTTRWLGNLFAYFWESFLRKAQGGMGVLSLWGCGCSMARKKDLLEAVERASTSLLFKVGGDDQAFALNGFVSVGMNMIYQPNAVVFHPQAKTARAFFQQTRRHRGNRTAKLMALVSLLSVRPYFAISMLALEVLFLITVRPVIEIVAWMLRCKKSWRPVNSRWSIQ